MRQRNAQRKRHDGTTDAIHCLVTTNEKQESELNTQTLKRTYDGRKTKGL